MDPAHGRALPTFALMPAFAQRARILWVGLGQTAERRTEPNVIFINI